jgi:hypothetical protein
MTNRQQTFMFCLGILIGFPSAVLFIHWLIVNMPDYALGFGSCAALWLTVKIIANGGK